MSANNFITELRRRRVFRTAGLYIVGAWVVLQVADLAFESWAVPDNAMRFLWIAVIVLFPVSLAFGWRYDITAAGIVIINGYTVALYSRHLFSLFECGL